MTSASFNDGWSVGPLTSIYAALQGAGATGTPVTLPHDALFTQPRSAELGEGGHSGYYPSGAFEYSKTFDVPEEYRGKRLTLEFQGAYRDAVVFVNDVYAAQRPNGYSTFFVPIDAYLRYAESNTVRVQVRAHQDSRWYTGAGLHRDTRLHVGGLVHLTPNAVRISTPDIDDERAVVELSTAVINEGLHTATVTVRTELFDPSAAPSASESSRLTLRAGETASVRQRLYVERPALWNTDSPALHSAITTLVDAAEEVLDETKTTFGIRTLQLDPQHGLRINGHAVKLRGACVHHDNGLLGSAAIARAEERRVRILKEAGFNAIRSSHNPLSEAMLDACDRHGMLVMDETFDVWTVSKSSFDYSLAFPEWWERDVEGMVAKDFNHPSVIMYSIGNENPETGDGLAAHWGRRMADRVRSLDGTRYVTNGINGFVSAIKEVAVLMQQNAAAAAAAEDQGINGAMNMGDFMNQISASAPVTEKTAEAFSVLDVAGMNYGDARYALDKELFPNRIIVGTETFPPHIDVNWRLVKEHSHVLGDFTWTGWDYLGEAGAGRITYLDGEDGVPSFEAGFPWLTAWTGDIDITGHRRTISYYRETVFGLRHEPYIAVQRPETFGRPSFAGQWAWSDTVGGWSWSRAAGHRTAVEVYSDADEVELTLNGETIGRQPSGPEHAYLARFELEVQPGELMATAFVGGEIRARTVLRSAHGRAHLHVAAEREVITADDTDLAYLAVELQDDDGVLAHDAEAVIQVEITGPGDLLAVGSGRPDQTERFDQGRHSTFDGRALVIVRPTAPGAIVVTVSAEGFAAVAVELIAEPADAPVPEGAQR